eukprot:scaffold31852_cov171-Skeletonema_menzelii.AAC.3
MERQNIHPKEDTPSSKLMRKKLHLNSGESHQRVFNCSVLFQKIGPRSIIWMIVTRARGIRRGGVVSMWKMLVRRRRIFVVVAVVIRRRMRTPTMMNLTLIGVPMKSVDLIATVTFTSQEIRMNVQCVVLCLARSVPGVRSRNVRGMVAINGFAVVIVIVVIIVRSRRRRRRRIVSEARRRRRLVTKKYMCSLAIAV